MMKRNTKLFCIVCRAEIPLERLLRTPAVTHPACTKELDRRRRALQREKKCHICGAPSTPEERREFNAWRKARGDKKKRGRKPKYPVPNPRQMDLPDEAITVN